MRVAVVKATFDEDARVWHHAIWITTEGKRIVVPIQIKSRRTANGILKEAGLSKAF